MVGLGHTVFVNTPRPIATARTRPGFIRMMGRAVRRRCPLCGGKKAWFIGYYKTQDRCRTCGFKYERGLDGYMTGAMTMNIIITFGLMTFTMVGFFVATFPHPPVLPLIGILLSIAILVPILVRPLTYTIWSGVDLLMRQPEPGEITDAGEHAGNDYASRMSCRKA